MMRSLLFALAVLIGLTAGAAAQEGCGPANPNCVVPTAPIGDNSNRAASTAFVFNAMVTPATRIKLTAPLTLFADFVNGNDANTCVVAGAAPGGSTAGACKTVQGAYNKLVLNYDTGGQNVTIHFVANDSSCLSMITPWVGGGTLAVTATGGSIVLSCAGGPAVNVGATLPGALLLNNMQLSGAFGVFINAPAFVQIRAGITFGANTSASIFSAASGATTTCTNANGGSGGAGYTLSGGGYAHIIVESGTVNCSNLAVTLIGAPAFSVFAQADNSGSSLIACNNTYTGSATGSRYLVTSFASINTCGGGASYLPGNSAGTATSASTQGYL